MVSSRLVKGLIGIAFFAACAVSARPAYAAASLDLNGLFAEPGVKLVVVEFFADWCKPCKAAIPKWNALHNKYGKAGLRLVVVSINENGSCANPGWRPDQTLCDSDGSLQRSWGVDKLPMAFLYSWRGERLVTQGHYAQVEQAIEKYFGNEPQLVIGELRDEQGRPAKDSLGLREQLLVTITKRNKFKLRIGIPEAAEPASSPLPTPPACLATDPPPATMELRLVWNAPTQTLRLLAVSGAKECLIAQSAGAIPGGTSEQAIEQVIDKLFPSLIQTVDSGESSRLENQAIWVRTLSGVEELGAKSFESLSGLLTAEVERVTGKKVLTDNDIRKAISERETLARAKRGEEAEGAVVSAPSPESVAGKLPLSVSGELRRANKEWVFSLRLLDSKLGSVRRHSTRSLRADQNALVEVIPAMVAELFAADTDTGKTGPLATARRYPMNPYKKAAYASFFSGLGLSLFGGLATWQAAAAGDRVKSGSFGDKKASRAWMGTAIGAYALGGAGMLGGILLWALAPDDQAWYEKHPLSLAPTLGPKGAGVLLGWRL